MNRNIKKITQGAMFLAIFGATLLINRELSFIFDQLVALISSLIIIIYITKFSMKDGIILSFCILIMAFFFGGIYVFVYTPLSIIAGLAYGLALKKNLERKTILFIIIVIYTIGEFILTLGILPLLGFGDLNEYVEITRKMFEMYGIMIDSESLYSISKMIYGIAIFMIAIMESILIHLSTIIIFKKFRLGTIKMTPIDQIRIKPIYAYISMFTIFALIFGFNYINNDLILFTLMAISLIGGALLIAQGYIFSLIYGIIVLRKNITFYLILLIVLLAPYSLIILLILGFLYATGPLYRYISKKRGI